MSVDESSSAQRDESRKGRLRDELRKYLIVSAYLYVCFGVLQLYKASLLQDAGVHYLPLGVAAVKALIVGKFLLIGDAVQARLRRRPGRLPGRIAKRVLWLLLILIVLTIAEEVMVAWVHGRSMVEMESEFHARSVPVLISEVLMMGLILVPLVAVAELSRALGPDVLQRLFLRPPDNRREAVGHGDTSGGEST